MSVINEEKLAQLTELSAEEKTSLAKENYGAIIKSVEQLGEEKVQQARDGIHIIAAAIVFGNHAFSQTESNFLQETIELSKEKALSLKYDAEEYFSDTVLFMKETLGEKEFEKLIEIAVFVATVDNHASKKEMKWLRKLRVIIG